MKRLLETMPPLERHRAARLLGLCPAVALPAGDAVGSEAFPDAAFLVVEHGMIAVASAPSARRRIVLGFATGGSVLPSPQGDEQLSGLTDSKLVAVTRVACRALLQRPPSAEAVVSGLIDTIRQRQESLGQFSNVGHADRLRAKLLQLARLHGALFDGGVSIQLPLTHELLGQTIGSARETVTMSLKALESEGFLVRDGRSYRLIEV